MTEQELRKSVKLILGDQIYEALERCEAWAWSGVTLPQLLDLAARDCFESRREDEHSERVREALGMLQNPGYFQFEKGGS